MHKLLVTEPSIGSYPACMLLALVCGYLISRWQAKHSGLPGRHVDNLALLIAVFSLFGARFFSWLFYFPPGISLWRAFAEPGGGMVLYGGVIFGALTVIIYGRVLSLGLRNLLDVFAPGLALGLAIGRVGCFLAGCCWGDLCVAPSELSARGPEVNRWQLQTLPVLSRPSFPLAVTFPEETGAFKQHRKLGLLAPQAVRSRPVHAVQLYEAAMALGLCVFLHARFRNRKWQGQIFCLFLLNYAWIRFVTEFLRADNRPLYGGFTLSQVISLLLAGCALLVWMRCARGDREERTEIRGQMSEVSEVSLSPP